jgi:hypothetical protein
MVPDQHRITDLPVFVGPARRVGEKKRFHSQCPENKDRKKNRRQSVPFVQVFSPAHDGNREAPDLSQDETPMMPRDAQRGEVRDFIIGEHDLVPDRTHETGKTRAEDETDGRRDIRDGADAIQGLVDFLSEGGNVIFGVFWRHGDISVAFLSR